MCCVFPNYFAGLLLLVLPLLSMAASTAEDDAVDTLEEAKEQPEKRSRLGGYKILPIPIFITEPAIGEGLGVALTVFHPVKEGFSTVPRATTPNSIGQERDSQAPPVATAVFGAYTNNDTWAAGIGHMNNWREDSIRYTGALATARINSTFYAGGLPIKYSMEGDMLYQDIKFRLADSRFFLGMSLSYLDATSKFSFSSDAEQPQGLLLDTDITNVGVALRGAYDSRDNTMNPNRGQLVDLSLWRYDDDIGGNYDYWSTTLKALSFHHFREQFTLGLRLDVSAVDGRPPFYGYPWVKLRGIPAMRYQDEAAGAVELEGRYKLGAKWEVLGFAGLGFTDGDTPVFQNPTDIYNYGVGGRYLVFKQQNVWVGLDVAQGPEELNWYIQVGHAW